MKKLTLICCLIFRPHSSSSGCPSDTLCSQRIQDKNLQHSYMSYVFSLQHETVPWSPSDCHKLDSTEEYRKLTSYNTHPFGFVSWSILKPNSAHRMLVGISQKRAVCRTSYVIGRANSKMIIRGPCLKIPRQWQQNIKPSRGLPSTGP